MLLVVLTDPEVLRSCSVSVMSYKLVITARCTARAFSTSSYDEWVTLAKDPVEITMLNILAFMLDKNDENI